jgi:hypothetical protein
MRMRTVQLGLASIAAVALLATACGASGDEGASEDGEGTTTTAVTGPPADGAFGDLTGVCGPGDARVPAAEAGRGADAVHLGVATDRNASIRPGLNREMWDTSVAFAEWCNAQGGIRGLPIELVELDGQILLVEQAMTVACRDVFAMVGGGFVQDNLEFTGKDGSDFHRCDLIDLPGYAVSPEKTDSNGQIQAVPNIGTSVPTTWIQDYAERFPEQARRVAIAYTDLPALEVQKNKYEVGASSAGMEVVGTFPYPVVGVTDWTPLARSIMDSRATTLMFVGEPGNLSNLLVKLREQGWEGIPLLETNMYDPLIFSTGTSAAEGAIVRSYLHPFEEADGEPATRQYLDLLEQYSPGAKRSSLGVLSMSSWLLFAVAANACADVNGGEITRECVLEQAAAVEDWTAGGLHAPVDPAPAVEAQAPRCGMLLRATNGGFVREFPERGGPDDDVAGFHCRDDGAAEVAANRGKGRVDPSRQL